MTSPALPGTTGPGAMDVVPLDAANARRAAIPCRICAADAVPFDVVDGAKRCSPTEPYPDGFSGTGVAFHRCRICGAMFSPFVDEQARAGLPDASARDMGDAVARHMLAGRRGWRNARILACGTGAPGVVAALRRGGYRHVEESGSLSGADGSDARFDIVLAAGLLEHAPEPVETVRALCRRLAPDGCLVVEQELQPDDIRTVRGNWWFVAPGDGHVFTYSADTMAALAQACGLTLHAGRTVHGLGRPSLSPLSRQVLSSIGRPGYFVPLLAPAIEARAGTFDWRCWSQGEVSGAGGFRWSLSGRLRWPLPELPHLPGTLRLLIPFCDRITPELLLGVTASQGWRRTGFRVAGSSLVADLEVTSAMSEIHVTTPEPVTPRSVRGDPDDRRIGIAVLARTRAADPLDAVPAPVASRLPVG